MMKSHSISIIFALLISFFLFCVPLSAQKGTIRGKLYNITTNEPLEFANIQIEGTTIGSTSDLDGNFLFTGIEPGFVRLVVTYIGFEPLISPEIQVIGKQVTNVNLPMTEKTTEIGEIVLGKNFNTKRMETPLSVLTVTTQDLEKIAGVNRDVSKVLQVLPGVGTMAVNRNDLIVRGGGPSENAFYMDGIELPILNHFTTQGSTGGVVSIVNPDFIREIDFYSGAFPASRGNALSSVMELRQKDGITDKLNLKLSLGASDAGIFVNGPMGDIGNYMVSFRQSYLNLLFSVLQLPFLPTYNDVQFRFKFKIDKKNEILLIGLTTCDRMKLNTGLKNPTEGQQYLLNTLPIYFQWSYTIGVNYKHYAQNHYNSLIVSRNFLQNKNYKYINNDDNQKKKFNYDSKESETKIRFESTYPDLPYRLQYGAGVMLSRYTNNTDRLLFVEEQIQEMNYSSAYYLFSYFAFFQYSNRFFDERFSVSAGINLAGNNYNSNMANPLNQLAPRLSLSYRFTPEWSINANVGRYAQRPAYTTMGYRNAVGDWVNKTNKLKYIKSYQAVFGFEYLPTSILKFTVEGFYKFYKDYPLSLSDGISIASKGADFGQIGDEAIISTGLGRCYGVEVLAQLRSWKGFTANISYTLFKSEYTDSLGTYIPSSWDSRNIVNISVGYSFCKSWYASVKWRYTGGIPYSPIDELSYNRAAWELTQQPYIDYQLYNTLRLKPNHQLDIRIDKEFYLKHCMLNLYIDVQNVYVFQAESIPIYTNRDKNGNIIPNPSGDDTLQGLRIVDTSSGTLLPSIGVIIKIQ